MKALILSSLLLVGCSTTVKSPVTQFEYTGYIKKEGVGVTIKPPGWQWAVDLYQWVITKEESKEE